MGRLLIVANRLPVTATTTADGAVQIKASAGGLATGLSALHERSKSVWIGWLGNPDMTVSPALDDELAARRLVAVALTVDEVHRYYDGFSNGVVWPLFHYLLERLPLDIDTFDAYEAVNPRFADAVVTHYRPDDVIWVHDYQLLLVPEMVRRQLPTARIGFFLRIPFPASEVMRTLPHRERLLEGVLGADLVGFHTASYMRHFATTVLRVLGAPSDVDRLAWRGRDVRIGVFPIASAK